MNNIKAFIFDLDGTLVETEHIYIEAIENVLKEANCSISHAEAVKMVIGISWEGIKNHIFTRFPGKFDENIAIKVAKHYMRIRSQSNIEIKSSVDLLKNLANEFPVCIVSGSMREDIKSNIKLMGIENCLKFYLGTEDYSPGKPDPTCYKLAAHMLNLPPENCLVFEDSFAGVTAAKKAGMHCVALKRQGAPDQDLSLADKILPDLALFKY